MQYLLTPNNSDLLPDVYRAVRRLLIDHRHGGDEIAEALSMHRRTLNRRLQAQGTSFQRVLDDVRFQVARELPRPTSLSMTLRRRLVIRP